MAPSFPAAALSGREPVSCSEEGGSRGLSMPSWGTCRPGLPSGHLDDAQASALTRVAAVGTELTGSLLLPDAGTECGEGLGWASPSLASAPGPRLPLPVPACGAVALPSAWHCCSCWTPGRWSAGEEPALSQGSRPGSVSSNPRTQSDQS